MKPLSKIILPFCPDAPGVTQIANISQPVTEKTSVPIWNGIARLVEKIKPDPETAHELLLKIKQPSFKSLRLNDLIFPRKAYFARLEGASFDEELDFEESNERLSSILSFWRRKEIWRSFQPVPPGCAITASISQSAQHLEKKEGSLFGLFRFLVE